MRRQAVLIGCVLATAGFAIQFAFGVLWPHAAFAALLVVLYLALKVLGDRLAGAVAPRAPRMRPEQEWLQWLRFGLPLALLQATLLAVGLTLAQSAAALFPSALFAADLGWLRAGMPLEAEADSLGRRLEAWP